MFAISSVSAVQNDTLSTNEIDNVDNEILSVSTETDTLSDGQGTSGNLKNDTLSTNEIDNVDDEILSVSNETDTLSDGLHSFAELENEMKENNITLNKSYIAHEGEIGIEITHSIEIDGKGHSIDGNGMTNIFKVYSLPSSDINIVLKNIVFKNANYDYGGAIKVIIARNVNIKIINCEFINNYASQDGAAIYYGSDGNLEVINSTFKKNKLDKNDFYTTYSTNGAAICTTGGTLTVSDSKFIENKGYGHGGAIYIENSNNAQNHIINCLFSKNSALRDGSAIYTVSKDGGLTVIGSRFLINRCELFQHIADGGTISSFGGYLTLLNSEFSYNEVESTWGAVIYASSKLTVDQTSFTGNKAYASCPGGAIYYNSNQDLKITNSKFRDNECADDGGGAIYMNTKSDALIENCEFIHNQAWSRDDPCYGGAIYNHDSGTITLKHCKFKDNLVDSDDSEGGAVYAKGNIVIEDCEFVGNSANKTGGAVYCGGELTLIGSSTFKNNHVSTDKTGSKATKGGAIYTSTFKSHVVGIFENNQAQYGGAIYINNKNDVLFRDCVFYKNSATAPDFNGCGAAIYVDSSSSKVTLEWNVFDSNYAVEDKGIYNCGKYGTISHNWWGTNNPNFDDGQIVEWHRITSNDKLSDNDYLKIVLTADSTYMYTYDTCELSFEFVDKNGGHVYYGPQPPTNAVTFESNKKSNFTSRYDHAYSGTTVKYTPFEGETNIITANFYSASVTESIAVQDFGDFSRLQVMINNAGKELNLTRNYTYTIGKDSMTDGIRISKPLTINGNGFTIDAKGQSRIFYIRGENVTINNLRLINGFSSYDGGAILVFNDYNAVIKNCIFENNTATDTGGAIRYTVIGKEGTIINSTFLNNKATIRDLTIDKTNETLTFTLTGKENYINAIYSVNEVYFTNVTYWNGQKVTENNPTMTSYAIGQNITLEIYNALNEIVKNITLKTNSLGQAIYNYTKFEDGNYTFKVYHPDDRYYTYIEQKGSFTLERTHTSPSEVKINIENKTEFKYGDCNISFEITNRTEVRVLITDADYTHIFYDEDTLLNYVELNLPAKDDYYRIIVTNYGNETYYGSSATKLFKITKINSTTSIDPISDNITYGDTVEVKFSSDDALYNITVFDENKKVAYNTIADKKTVQISNLNAGNYTVLIVNCGSENKTSSNASATFEIKKKDNYYAVEVEDTVYGNPVTIFVVAEADGNYTVDINSTKIIVEVKDGMGNASILLGAGFYYANVTFNNTNYNNFPTNTTFTVDKATSPVWISIGNVTYGKNTTVHIYDKFPTLHNITIYDSGLNIVYHNLTRDSKFVMPVLPVGSYNLTVVNLGNENITRSEDSKIFKVTMDNFVEITIEDAVYGRLLPITIVADIDGYYYVDINGTKLMIEVTDGFGYNDTLDLGAGFYYANVTFDNPDYNTHIHNTTFTIYKAESNIAIYDIENVTCGEVVIIEYIDDYNATFRISIMNEKGELVRGIETDEMKVEVPALPAGNYTVIVTNLGNENITGLSDMMNFTVYKADTEMNISEEYNKIIVNLPKDATGFVLFEINNYNALISVKDGKAVLNYDLDPDTYNLTATYLGDDTFNTNTTQITFTVKLATSITASKVTATYGTSKKLTLTLKDVDGYPLSGEEVAVNLNGKTYNGTTNANGQFSVDVPKNLVPKTYTAYLSFDGDDTYVNSAGSAVVNVVKAASKITAKKKTFKAITKVKKYTITLKSGKTPIKKVQVTLKVKGKTYTAKTNVKGKAVFKINKLTKKGTYTAVIKFKGNKYYKATTKKVKITVVKQKAKIIAKKKTFKAKTKVKKYTITLKSGKTPIKKVQVTLKIKGKKIIKAKTNTKGKAVFKINKLTKKGTYTAAIKFKGNNYYKAVSKKIKITIK